MGIRGTVRRSTDSWFVHCNVDTDVMLWEGDSDDPTLKPPEMYTLVENFCLGLRRLELFARGKTLRRGWVSVLSAGEEERIPLADEEMKGIEGDRSPRLWDKEKWDVDMKEIAHGGKLVVPMTSGSFISDGTSSMTHNFSRYRGTTTKVPRPRGILKQPEP